MNDKENEMLENALHELTDKSDHDLLLLTAQSSLRAEQQLVKMNGTIKDTCIKLAKTTEIAEEAKCQGESNKKRMDTLIFQGIIGFLIIGGGVVAAIIEGLMS
jgi:hypothetical protein